MAAATSSGAAESQTGDGRTGAAQETAERAGLFRGGDDSIEKRNELCSERLVQMIDQGAAQLLVIAARERGGDGAGVAAGLDRAQAIDLVRQDPARFRCLDFEGRDEQDKTKPRIDRELLVPITARHDEAAKLRRRGVVGMAFELGAEPENLRALQRPSTQRVQARGARRAAR